MEAESPSWVVSEDAALRVLVALYLRQALGIRHPEELPHLRGIPSSTSDAYVDASTLERRWPVL